MPTALSIEPDFALGSYVAAGPYGVGVLWVKGMGKNMKMEREQFQVKENYGKPDLAFAIRHHGIGWVLWISQPTWNWEKVV